MEMRRKGDREKKLIRKFLTLYKWISLYGERPIRALGWLVALFLSYGFIYSLFDLVVIGDKIDTSVKSKFVKGLMISLSNLTLGRTSPIFEVTNPVIGNILQGTEIIAGAVLLSLFILAMNRKFRRTKD